MSWVLSCETGISKVLIFFRCGEGIIISCDEWRVWDGPCTVEDLCGGSGVTCPLPRPIQALWFVRGSGSLCHTIRDGNEFALQRDESGVAYAPAPR